MSQMDEMASIYYDMAENKLVGSPKAIEAIQSCAMVMQNRANE